MPGGISVPTDNLTLTEQFLMAMGKRNEVPRENLEALFLNGTVRGPDNLAPDNIGSSPDCT